jgi:drug/metabolite transporter (DMT)-like permease
MSSQGPAPGGLLLALGAAASYGFNITFARVAAFEGVNGTTLVAWRVLVMLAAAGGAAVVMRSGIGVPREERKPFLVLLLGSAGVSICYICSVAYIPVAVAAVIFYTFPILIVLLSPFVEGRRLDAALLGVVLLAFAGVVLVVGPGLGDLDPRGLMLAAGASLSAVVQFFAANRCVRTPTLPKIIWIQLGVLPIVIVAAILSGGLQPASAALLAPMAMALNIGGYLVGFVLHMLSLVRIRAVVAGLAFCLEPVVAALTSAVVLDERLSPVQYGGGACVIAAIVANVLAERRRTAVPAAA